LSYSKPVRLLFIFVTQIKMFLIKSWEVMYSPLIATQLPLQKLHKDVVKLMLCGKTEDLATKNYIIPATLKNPLQ